MIALNNVPISIEWSHLQENVLRTLSRVGEIKFYDYRKQRVIKSCNIDQNIRSAAFYVKGLVGVPFFHKYIKYAYKVILNSLYNLYLLQNEANTCGIGY